MVILSSSRIQIPSIVCKICISKSCTVSFSVPFFSHLYIFFFNIFLYECPHLPSCCFFLFSTEEGDSSHSKLFLIAKRGRGEGEEREGIGGVGGGGRVVRGGGRDVDEKGGTWVPHTRTASGLVHHWGGACSSSSWVAKGWGAPRQGCPQQVLARRNPAEELQAVQRPGRTAPWSYHAAAVSASHFRPRHVWLRYARL